MPRDAVAVLGAGGHAKVIISTLRAGGIAVAAIYDDCPDLWGTSLLGISIRGPLTDFQQDHCMGAIAVGDNRLRQQISQRWSRGRWMTAVHPAAYVDPDARLGPGTVVMAGAVIQPGAWVGAHVIVNTGATVDHDCYLGDYVHVGPGTHLAGGVRIGEGTMLGVSSAVTPGCRVGDWAMVGAGAVVIRDLADGVRAAGVPARPLHTPLSGS